MKSENPGAKSRTQMIGSIGYLRHELEYHNISDYGGEILSGCKNIIDQHTGEIDLGLQTLPTETYASFNTVTTRRGKITFEKNDPLTVRFIYSSILCTSYAHGFQISPLLRARTWQVSISLKHFP